MPFMPEMLQQCGREVRCIGARTTCDTTAPARIDG
jgi:hypothetical protein